MKLSDYLSGSYYSQEFLRDRVQGPLSRDKSEKHRQVKEKAFTQIRTLYRAKSARVLAGLNESTLETEWLSPVLTALGWSFSKGDTFSPQGKSWELDFILFESDVLKQDFYTKKDKGALERFKGAVICENKSWGRVLDTNSTLWQRTSPDKDKDKGNPHLQIVNYLLQTRVRWGFLTNGYLWRLYDSHSDSNDKVYYEVNLQKILDEEDSQAFGFFYYLFSRENFYKSPTEDKSTIVDFERANLQKREALEKSLQNLLYGKGSIIEEVGTALYESLREDKEVTQEDLRRIFYDSLIFLFRLVFMAYYESTFKRTLEYHSGYNKYSIYELYYEFKREEHRHAPVRFECFELMKALWQHLDKGNTSLGIPMLNGGLFAEERAPLLLRDKALNNQLTRSVLHRLLISDATTHPREYNTLSVKHLGSLYEGFLEYEFRIAAEDLYFVTTKEGVEGYYNSYDMFKLGLNRERAQSYHEGALYLSSRSNNRKTSASYYTPDAFTRFQAKEAIRTQRNAGKSLYDLKIIDNACGSGHYLVSALSELTQQALESLEETPELKALLAREKQRIYENLAALNIDERQFDIFVDDLQVLKRLLVKRCLFGVDLSGIAVELTRLSLWIQTFVFGTPLSFIEHHIKEGNALVGLELEEVYNFLETNNKSIGVLFLKNFTPSIDELKEAHEQLTELNDTTLKEIEKSKKIFKEKIKPKLEKINRVFNFILYGKMLDQKYLKQKKGTEKQEKSQSHDNKIIWDLLSEARQNFSQFEGALTFHTRNDYDAKWHPLLDAIEEQAHHHKFFHTGVEFPEVTQGFDIVLGNPPWDKVKFSEDDFYPQYHSAYRTGTHSQKAAIRDHFYNDFTYQWIRERYDQEKESIQTYNDYLKQTYPLAGGAGDNDLFRYFIARNLKLLAPRGVLGYLTPSSWSKDPSGKNIRQEILTQYTLNFLYQFENRTGFFQDVHRSYKVAVWQIQSGPMGDDYPIKVRFMSHNPAVLGSDEGIMIYPPCLVRALSPENQSFLGIQSEGDVAFLKKVSGRFETLKGVNLDFIRELDMANNKDLFHEQVLNLEGINLDFINELHMTSDKNLFHEQVTDKEGFLPLYEGKMIWQYDSTFAKPTYWVKASDLEEKLRNAEEKRMIGALFDQLELKLTKELKTKQQAVMDALDLTAEELGDQVQFDYEVPRLAFREVAGGTDERTVIASILPAGMTAGNTLWLSMQSYFWKGDSVQKDMSLNRLFFLQGILNSLVVDRFVRFIANMHVTKSVLQTIPLPQPSDNELISSPLYSRIVLLSKTLTYYHNPTGFPWLQLQIDPRDWGTHKNQWDTACEHTRAEIDALVAEVYGITSAEMQHLLSSFVVMNRKRPYYGELVLAAMAKRGI